MIRSLSDSFMVPKNPRIFDQGAYKKKSVSFSPATYYESRHPTTDKAQQSKEIIIDHDVEEPLIRNRQELLILIGMAYLYLNANVGFAIIAPFLPIESKKKNIGTLVQGLIFAIYPFVIFIVSPLLGKWMPKVGVKFSMIGGSFVQGCSLVILGSLDYIEDDQLFLIYCFILRVVMAIGAAGCETGCLSIVSISFKHRMSTAQGVMSGSSGVGLMLGPVIGGVLYKFGGFKLPLMSIGVLICSAALLTFFVLPEESTFRVHRHDDQTVSFLKVITIPGIFIMGTVSLTAGMVISFLDPTLTNYVEVLTDNSVSSALVGLIFLCIPVTYTVFTPILGYLIDKKISGRYACIIGAYLGGICFLFIGPCPLFFPWIEPNLWLLIGVLLALGAFSITSLFVPVLNEMQLIARKANLPLGMGTDSILSGIYTANFNLGSMVGPTLGGALTDNLQFPWASAAFGALLLFEATLLLIFTVLENICSRKKKIKQPVYNGMSRGRPRLSSTNIVPYHQICDPRIDSTAALPTIESSGEEYITRVGDRVSVRAYQQPRYDRFLPSPKEEDEHFMEKSCEIIE